MGERMRELRRALKLNQTEFGRRIGLTTGWVSRVETSERNLTEQMMVTICNVYNVRDEWLRTGEGEMFLQEPSKALAALATTYRLNEPDRDLVAAFVEMTPKDRSDCLYYVLRHACESAARGNGVPLTAADQAAALDREEAAEHDRVRAEFARRRASL